MMCAHPTPSLEAPAGIRGEENRELSVDIIVKKMLDGEAYKDCFACAGTPLQKKRETWTQRLRKSNCVLPGEVSALWG